MNCERQANDRQGGCGGARRLLGALALLAVGCATASPELAASHQARGDALFARGDLTAAIAEYREASRLAPGNPGVWLQLAHLYEASGRGEDALRSLERGLEANPDDAGLLNQMGWVRATSDDPALRDPAKALDYAKRAVEASGGADANILDTLAEAYFANREFDRAIETEERALAIAPGVDAYRTQLEKFRAARAAEAGR